MSGPTPSTLVFEINAPQSGNSFSLEIARAFEKRLRAERYDAVLLIAKGRLFCSGGNLSDYAGMSKSAEGKRVNREIARILKFISELKVPTVCAVQGDCWGGGVEVASAFDHVIAVPDAAFGLWQRRIGLTFGWSGGVRLLRRLSSARLSELALSTRMLLAREALALGLIDRVCLRAHLLDEGHAWIARAQSLPQAPFAPLKSALISGVWNALRELSLFEKLWWNTEHKAILAERKSSRPPPARQRLN